MAEPLISYLRIRVVDRNPLYYFTDGFEETGSGVKAPFWISIGTDATGTLTYWNQVAGVWTIASNLVTTPAANNSLMVGGHADWANMTALMRFKWVTGASCQLVIHCDGTDANHIFGFLNGTTIGLEKVSASVFTLVTSTAATPVNGNFYWLQVAASGTNYKVQCYNDSAGVPGSTFGAQLSGTIADAALQSGLCGARTGSATSYTIGGAFTGVYTITGPPPDGTQGQAWTPLVTAGEPAFAWSKVAPQAGTYSASIYNRNAGGNGAWQQAIRLFSAATGTLSAQAKASAGTANVSAGGLTTGNAGTSFGALAATGAITANPTVSCNYSGAVGTAYFDSLSITNPAYEITTDLPCLHQSHIDTLAMQPGNPGSSAIGTWTIQLHPPGTDAYAAAKTVYDKLDYLQRVEGYISHDGSALGKLFATGVITGKRITYGGGSSVFELTVDSDLYLAQRSVTFQGELFANDVTSALLKSYLGTNEPGLTDSFSSFTAANYVSANEAGGSLGTWSATTDDGFNVVSCATGVNAVLISKTGAAAGDRWHTQFVQVTGRILPTGTSTTNAGRLGLGLSQTFIDVNNSIGCYLTIASITGGRYKVQGFLVKYVGGVATIISSNSNVLTNVDDPQGYIPLTVGLLVTTGGNVNGTATATLIVNGRILVGQAATGVDLGTVNYYPFIKYSVPASGTATLYLRDLVQFTRVTTDGPSAAATFGNGSITTATHSIGWGVDPGANFLEVWSRLAGRDGWYWRYTPQPYVLGTRTLGVVDFSPDPGTDRSASVVFDRDGGGGLVEMTVTTNADQFATGTVTSGQPTIDGGGIASSVDVSSIQKFGAWQDETVAHTLSDFASLRLFSGQLIAHKVAINLAGSKKATILRDPGTADTFRELDKITVNDPLLGLNNASARVLGLSFDEGQATQDLILDQFAE